MSTRGAPGASRERRGRALQLSPDDGGGLVRLAHDLVDLRRPRCRRTEPRVRQRRRKVRPRCVAASSLRRTGRTGNIGIARRRQRLRVQLVHALAVGSDLANVPLDLVDLGARTARGTGRGDGGPVSAARLRRLGAVWQVGAHLVEELLHLRVGLPHKADLARLLGRLGAAPPRRAARAAVRISASPCTRQLPVAVRWRRTRCTFFKRSRTMVPSRRRARRCRPPLDGPPHHDVATCGGQSPPAAPRLQGRSVSVRAWK